MSGLGPWTGGGISPLRLDRRLIADRLSGAVETWIADPLLDAFERAALDAIRRNGKAPADKE